MPVGEMCLNTLDSIVSAARETYKCVTKQAEAISVPHDVYNVRRRHYNSTRLLKHLETLKPEAYDMLLGVMERTFTFRNLTLFSGKPNTARVAVIGLPRLRQEFGFDPDPGLFLQRAAKEAIRELGHLKGLGHCRDLRGVMHFSNSLEETDMKQAKFCSHCRNKLKEER